MNVKLETNRFKACHILPGTKTNGCPESVICKFVYFDEKDRAFCLRRKLKKIKSPLNNLNRNIDERLPKYEAEKDSEAEKTGMITSTKTVLYQLWLRICKTKHHSEQ